MITVLKPEELKKENRRNKRSLLAFKGIGEMRRTWVRLDVSQTWLQVGSPREL